MTIKQVYYLLIFLIFTTGIVHAQTNENLLDHSFSVNGLDSKELKKFLSSKIKGSQFIMVGEQHGIKEVGQLTNTIYSLSKPLGYNTICIETDAIAAKQIGQIALTSRIPETGFKQIHEEFPYAIPFYGNNKDDINLFTNVVGNGGSIWGIDQTFMVQFRLNFQYLLNNSTNKKLRMAIKPLLEESHTLYKKAIDEKNYQAPFIFKYTDELHTELMNLATTDNERKVLEQLLATRNIYGYNFNGRFYLNNNERAKLMKQNFMSYYNNFKNKTSKEPKVIFKLGSNHVARGLNYTNVFDIANMVSEIAVMNGKTSLHIMVSGINGTQNLGNPFAPVTIVPFDNTKKLPEEVSELLTSASGKYVIIDVAALRSKAKNLSSKMKDIIFKYDILVYIKDCKALEGFN